MGGAAKTDRGVLMTLPLYPDATVLPGLGFGVKWTPIFFNMDTAKTASGAEIDLALASTPLHQFELNYTFLHDWGRSLPESVEYRTLFGFVLQMGGTIGRFRFKNPDDFQVYQQAIGTGDSTTTTFALSRFYGASGFGLTEPVGVVDPTTVQVYLGGSATPQLPASYTISTANPYLQTITFATAPTAGQAIAVDMAYWYVCKFDANNFPFEKFADRLWNLNKVIVRSCRPGA